jgi:hypothetical protein
MAPCLAHSGGPSYLGLTAQGRAISCLFTGMSQLRPWIVQMSADAAALNQCECPYWAPDCDPPCIQNICQPLVDVCVGRQ